MALESWEAGDLVSRNVGKQTAVGKLSPRQSQVPVSEVTAEGEEDSEQGGERHNGMAGAKSE